MVELFKKKEPLEERIEKIKRGLEERKRLKEMIDEQKRALKKLEKRIKELSELKPDLDRLKERVEKVPPEEIQDLRMSLEGGLKEVKKLKGEIREISLKEIEQKVGEKVREIASAETAKLANRLKYLERSKKELDEKLEKILDMLESVAVI